MINIKTRVKDIFDLLKQTFKKWNEDKPFDLSSSVAYYAIFSLPALLMIVISIAGLVLGREAVQGKIAGDIGAMIGKDGGKDIQEMIANSYKSSNSVISSIIGIATLLLGSTAVFLQLQTALNAVWNIKASPKAGIKKLLLDRATALGVIMAIGFLLLISLVLTSALSALSNWIQNMLPDVVLYLFYVVNFIVAFGVTSLMFALMYKILPDIKIGWRSVWRGAFLTAFLFETGRFAISFYFGKSDPGSAYGAAGTVILIMLWVYYSCLILLFGAEFTVIYARKYGYPVEVSENAVKIKTEEEVLPDKKVA
jgi:membrane protein